MRKDNQLKSKDLQKLEQDLLREYTEYALEEHTRIPGIRPGTSEYEKYKIGLDALKRADPFVYEQLTNWN